MKMIIEYSVCARRGNGKVIYFVLNKEKARFIKRLDISELGQKRSLGFLKNIEFNFYALFKMYKTANKKLDKMIG